MKLTILQTWWRSLGSALMLMTILPVKYPKNITTTEQRRSIYYYPVVGAILGLILWLVAKGLGEGTFLNAALILLVWIVFTGAIHLDGLADCADAWMAGLGDREKTMRILKDPLCGSIAVVTLIIILLLKVAAIQQLLETGSLTAFVVIPVLARVTPQILFWRLTYVREAGLGSALKTSEEDRILLWCSSICSVILAVILMAGNAIWLLMIAALVVWVIAKASVRRLGGFTGDVAGAQIELVECALCVSAALLV